MIVRKKNVLSILKNTNVGGTIHDECNVRYNNVEKKENFMPATVRCPYCGTTFTTTINTQTTCRNRDCKAIIHVDANGNIRKSTPGKRK